MFLSRYRYSILALALLSALCGYLFQHVLFQDQSLVHADNLHHGYAFLKFHSDVIHKGVSPFWTNQVYGGHALFAESQAGLSNPVNYLVAWLFAPTFGQNLLHFLSMIAMGMGSYGFARSLGANGMAALFAALAASFSSLFIHTNTNLTAIEATVWIPFTLWAFEAWLKQPDWRRSVVFGGATAMQIFSGYPHFLHGTAIYMVVSGATLFIDRTYAPSAGALIAKYWRWGILAVLVCVGLSCIQWLPLLELSNFSHRQNGTAVSASGLPSYVLPGFIYSTVNEPSNDVLRAGYFPVIGSLLVCVLASLALFLPASARTRGHLIALVILFNLGMGETSPVFRFVTRFHLIPGIENFRILFPYFYPAIFGAVAVAAVMVTRLGETGTALRVDRGTVLRLLLAAAFWAAVIAALHSNNAPTLNYLVLGIALAGLGLVTAIGRPGLFPGIAVAALLLEIIVLKLHPFSAVDNAILTTPPDAVRYIKAEKNYRDYKHYHIDIIALLLSSPYGDKLERNTGHELNSIVASTNLLWDIPSYSGALALQMKNRPMATEEVIREIRGESDQQPGLRLMDIYSIRWVSKSKPGQAESLIPIKNAKGRPYLYLNKYAKPQVQTYHNVEVRKDPQDIFAQMKQVETETLFLQAGDNDIPAAQLEGLAVKPWVKTLESSATRYRLRSRADAGFWLFLADNYYPGWAAEVDGKPVPLYPAQLLGKALYVPEGEHRIKLTFKSQSVSTGAWVTGLTLLLLTIAGLLTLFRRKA